MTTQTAQPIERESITITLTPEEHEFVIWSLEHCLRYTRSQYIFNLYNKLQFTKPNIGDACRHSAHIPEAPGQDGTDSDDDDFFPCSEISWIVNHARERRLGLIDDCDCASCKLYHSAEENAAGQGGNHEN
jgi:hypothetical protein